MRLMREKVTEWQSTNDSEKVTMLTVHARMVTLAGCRDDFEEMVCGQRLLPIPSC